MTGREITDVLERFFVLEWFRNAVSKVIEQYNYPPVIVWRYDAEAMKPEDIKRAENMIITAVKTFQGNVSWVLYFSGRNWVLLPKRVKDLEDSGAFLSDTEIITELGASDPSFGVEANNDLPALAKCMEEYLSKSSG